MADLSGFLSGVFGADGYMKDFAHASRLYRDDGFYDYAPKAGWMYYVSFGINSQVRKDLDPTWAERHSQNVGILAKAADLPKFKITTETVNQYNRKAVVQTKLNYEPITITLHDDMINASTDLWKNYYKYYFADGLATTAAIGRGSRFSESFRDNKHSEKGVYNYGLANAQTVRFFDSIEIFLLNKKKFQSFILLNPIIKEWRHGDVDQSQGSKMLESKMTIEYESVIYNRGKASNSGFRADHYDNSPSPLAVAGLGGVLGAGGLISNAADLFGDNSIYDPSTNAIDLINTGLAAANLVKNVSKISGNTLKQEAYSILGGVLYTSGGGNSNTPDYANRTGAGGSITGLYSASGTGAVNLYKQYPNSSVNPGTAATPRSITGR
jgi:hypothetical protein